MIIVLAAAAFVALAPCLLTGDILYYRDLMFQYYPWQSVVNQAIRSGHLPFWNPDVYCGTPLLANIQTSVFYPPKIIFYLLPSLGTAMAWYLFFHVWWAMFGMWRLLIVWRCHPGGAALGAIAYGLSTFMTTRFEFPPILATASWLPWILLGVHHLIQTPKFHWKYAGLTGIAVGFKMLAGNPQNMVIGALAISSYALWWFPRKFHWIMVPYFIGFGLAACQWFPFLELLPHTIRGEGFNLQIAMRWSLSWEGIGQLFSPWMYGDPSKGTYYLQDAWWPTSAYIGIVTLLSGGIAIGFKLLKERHVFQARWALTLMVISVTLALGDHTPILPWLYRWIPPLKIFRYPGVMLFLWTIGGSILGAIGLSKMMSSRHVFGTWRQWTVPAVILIGIGLFFLDPLWWLTPLLGWYVKLTPEPFTFQRIFSLVQHIHWFLISWSFSAIWISLALGIVACQRRWNLERHVISWVWCAILLTDLIYASWTINPTRSPVEVFTPSKLSMRLDSLSRQDTPSSRVYMDPVLFKEFYADFGLENRLGSDGWRDARYLTAAWNILHPNLSLLSGIPTAQGYDPLQFIVLDHLHDRISLQTSATETPLLSMMGVKYLFSRRMLREPGLRLKETVDGMHVYALKSPLGRAYVVKTSTVFPTQSLAPVSWNTDRPEQLILETSSPIPAYLVIADTWYPGWSVKVNGQLRPALKFHKAFRAVEIPAGPCRVEWTYTSRSFWLGLTVTCLTIFGLMAIMIYSKP